MAKGRARKRGITLYSTAFADYAEQLDQLGANLNEVFSNAMEKAGNKVQEDTRLAMEAQNLPAGGKYSTGQTADAIITDPKVKWEGSVGEIDLGFDKTQPGAGGFLITGTPKMRPNMALQKIYGSKKYERDIVKDIEKSLQDEIDSRKGGS